MSAAEYREWIANGSPVARKDLAGTSRRWQATDAVAMPVNRKPVGRDTPKEQPGPKPDAPLRWQVAGPLFAEQFPGEFAVRITGPATLLPALVKALEELVKL